MLYYLLLRNVSLSSHFHPCGWVMLKGAYGYMWDRTQNVKSLDYQASETLFIECFGLVWFKRFTAEVSDHPECHPVGRWVFSETWYLQVYHKSWFTTNKPLSVCSRVIDLPQGINLWALFVPLPHSPFSSLNPFKPLDNKRACIYCRGLVAY